MAQLLDADNSDSLAAADEARSIISHLKIRPDLPLAILAWFVLTYVAGHRLLGHDEDYTRYLSYYRGISDQIDFSDTRYFPGFVALAWFCKSILGFTFASFLMLIAGCSLATKIVLFRRRPLFWFILLAYIPSLYLTQEMTQIRAALGISFAYLAIDFKDGQKPITCVILFLLSLSMHSSTIALLPFFIMPLKWTESRRALTIISIAVGLFAAIAGQILTYFSVLDPLISYYVEGFVGGITIFSALNLCVILISLMGIFRFWRLLPTDRLQVMMASTGFVLFLATTSAPPIAHRLIEVFLLSVFLIASRLGGRLALAATALLFVASAYLGYRQSDYNF